VALLQALADSTSIAMENVQIYNELEQRVHERTAALEQANEEIRRLSLTDDLTGLNNRRGFHLLADAALLAARTHGHDCALAFLDVDGLKQVNDEDGHDVGDGLITDVADVLRDVLSLSDIVGRLGGDEFAVLVSEFGDGAAALKARLLEAFRRFNETGARHYRLAASIGVVEVPYTDISSLDQLLARADELMYEDKKAKPAAGVVEVAG
jgi:diguanylate cyclase (GGDEF)-like protein